MSCRMKMRAARPLTASLVTISIEALEAAKKARPLEQVRCDVKLGKREQHVKFKTMMVRRLRLPKLTCS